MDENERQALYDSLAWNKKWGIIIFVVIFVGFLIYALFGGNPSATFDITGTEITVKGPDDSDFEYTLDLHDVTSVKYVEDFDFGTLISGKDEKRSKFGLWENEEYGEYALCITPGIPGYVVVEATNGCIVLNIESDATTEEYSRALLRYMDENGIKIGA